MKKVFINPEVETVELIPAENIMLLNLAKSAEGQTSHKLFTDDEAGSENGTWNGFDE